MLVVEERGNNGEQLTYVGMTGLGLNERGESRGRVIVDRRVLPTLSVSDAGSVR